jgi:hypothetical protein
MAQQIQRWAPSTELSPQQKWDRAVTKVRYSISPQQAAEFGKQLVGQWPHANPPNPETYSLSIAKTLEKYPLGVVEECCDPQTGLARFREYPPTVAAVVEWCELRTRAYVAISQRRPPTPEVVHSEEHCATMRERLRNFFVQWKAGGFNRVSQ